MPKESSLPRKKPWEDIVKAVDEAPDDDEPVTEEDVQALREAAEDVRTGRTVDHDDAMRELQVEPPSDESDD